MGDQKIEANKLKDLGNGSLSAGNIDQAIEYYSKAINLDDQNHVLFSNRSAAYVQVNRFEEALKDAQETIALQPAWGKGYSRKGAALEYMGKYQEALNAYEEGLKKDPANQQLKDSAAKCRKKLYSSELPLQNPFGGPDLMAKLAMNPKTRAYLSDPSYIAMINELQRHPNSMSNLLKDKRILDTLGVLMGLNLDQTGDEAMDTSEQEEVPKEEPKPAPKTNPRKGDPPAEPISNEKKRAASEKDRGNDAYRKHNFEQALEHYEQAFKFDSTDMTFLNNIAAVYFEQGKYEECIKQCDKAVEVGPRIANSHYKLKNFAKAKEYYEKSLSEHRTPETKAKLSEIEKIFKQEQQKAYINPEIALIEKNLGNDCFSKGDYPQAVKHYSEAIKRNPDDAKLFSNRAACYTKLAEFQLGLRDCDECIRLEPDFIKGYTRKGTILMALKDESKASAAFRKAVELDPNNQEAIDGFRRCSMALNSDPEEVRRHAMSDPDVQKILKDPAMRLILEQMQDDPKALQEHLRNPEIARKIQKLIESGLIAIR
uniref:Stress-induced-phosphoprotein 1 n=1 Tax=Strigamia maritima TaxID=126957 RepID=T1IPV7_STRMM